VRFAKEPAVTVSSDPGDSKIIVKVDPDLIEIVPQFLENVIDDIAAIGEAVAEGDFEKARILGHSMKGAGAGYGFDRLSDYGKVIESAAAAKDASLIDAQVANVRAYLAAVVVESGE
jgi:HPt (histidine-containing phosphotransfer) domain-containing protein